MEHSHVLASHALNEGYFLIWDLERYVVLILELLELVCCLRILTDIGMIVGLVCDGLLL